MQDPSPKYLDRSLFWIYLLLLISIIFSLRAISSICIGLTLLSCIVQYKKLIYSFVTNKLLVLFAIGCGLLFLVQCLSLIYTSNIQAGTGLLQRRSALLLIPLAALSGIRFLTIEKREKLLWYFSMILCVAAFYCLAISLLEFIKGSPASVFFHHDLVKPLSQHAIQFSVLVFIALAFLIRSSNETKRFTMRKVAIGFLSFFLLLLASKLIICFYAFYLLYFFFSNLLERSKAITAFVFISVIITSVTVLTPLRMRFLETFSGSATLFRQGKFDPGIYFNGVQFRLLQWRFTYEILQEQQAWILGLSPGDAQAALDKKYVETHMYLGEPGTGDHGFLGYHTHNQFLQILLENGLIGLLAFLFITYSLIDMARKDKGKELKPFVLLILLYCFTDAPLETQYGLVLFTLFPFLLQCGFRTAFQAQSKPPSYPVLMAAR